MEIQRGLMSEIQGYKCFGACKALIRGYPSHTKPIFSEMSPIKQKFETCLDEFQGPNEFFDYQTQNSASMHEMLRVLQKNGFVVIENFFPKELMDRVYDALTTW